MAIKEQFEVYFDDGNRKEFVDDDAQVAYREFTAAIRSNQSWTEEFYIEFENVTMALQVSRITFYQYRTRQESDEE